jgi:alcohol dehydrogenase class IV
LEAIRLVSANLLGAIEQPLELRYRDPMMLGSLLAGLAFSNASLGLVHAMAHALGGLMDLPHGECNAMLLGHVVNFNFDSSPERYSRIAEAFGLRLEGLPSEEIKKQLVSAIQAFRQRAGLSHSLQDYGVSQNDIHLLAQHAFHDPCMVTNPVQPAVEDIERIYEQALTS